VDIAFTLPSSSASHAIPSSIRTAVPSAMESGI
jgi:hypothetical protein